MNSPTNNKREQKPFLGSCGFPIPSHRRFSFVSFVVFLSYFIEVFVCTTINFSFIFSISHPRVLPALVILHEISFSQISKEHLLSACLSSIQEIIFEQQYRRQSSYNFRKLGRCYYPVANFGSIFFYIISGQCCPRFSQAKQMVKARRKQNLSRSIVS